LLKAQECLFVNLKRTTMSDPSQNQGSSGPVAGAKAALWLLLVINLFNYIDRQVLSAVVPNIKESLLANQEQTGFIGMLLHGLGRLLGSNPENAMVGLLATAFLATYMIAAPVLSNLPLRRWWTIAGGIVVWTLASGASGLALTFGGLLLTRCFVGIGEAAYGPVAPSILSDFYSEEKRNKVLSWFYLAIPVGSALGFVLGGLVAGSSLGWRWAFYLVVPPGLLIALLCLFMRDPLHTQNKAVVKDTVSRWTLYKQFLSNPSYLNNTLAMTAMTFAIGGIGFWAPTYLHEYRHAGSLAEVNLAFGAILVLAGLSATLMGAYFNVSGWAMMLAFPSILGMLYAPFPMAWIFVFLACFFLFFNTGPSNTALANVVLPRHRPAAFALNILFIHLFGDVLSPLVIGAVTDAAGNNMTVAFLVVSVTVLVGGLFWMNGARFLDADTKAAALAAKNDRN
jgi:MFS family permease